jgi:Rod binding domain-containing protein
MSQLSAMLPLRGNSGVTPIALKERGDAGTSSAMPLNGGNHGTEELRETFTQFVGEMFYGQMFKAMRSTVGKPAYFHGGRAEEAFQGQLDQTMTEQLTKATASKFAEPMFERQFPHLVEKPASSDLGQLDNLRRR